ncbi:MAG: helix-turn-helix transcriptional regulator [Patescibacteria group bacterium]
MDKQEALRLGNFLRQKRQDLNLSTRALEKLCGITNPTIVRIENGEFVAPSPKKLARLANALNLPLADVYALAGYIAPKQLPNLKPYLNAKYSYLPEDVISKLEDHIERIIKQEDPLVKT